VIPVRSRKNRIKVVADILWFAKSTERQGPELITLLLGRVREGDREALEQLLPLVYGELHRLARSALRRDCGLHTLQPTALLNETCLRLFGRQLPEFSDRCRM
jgi:hypothetical protein